VYVCPSWPDVLSAELVTLTRISFSPVPLRSA